MCGNFGVVADGSRKFQDLQEVLGDGDFLVFRLKLPTVEVRYFRAAGSPRCKCLTYSVGIIPQQMSRFKIFLSFSRSKLPSAEV
jgi:hypothetical protein